MNFVLDTSVTMRWCFGDGSAADRAYAARVLNALSGKTALVPATWGLEVANVLARAEIRSGFEIERSDNFIAMLGTVEILVDTDTFDQALSATFGLARQYQLSSYDASYLELALRRGLPLATLDAGLRKAARKAGVTRL